MGAASAPLRCAGASFRYGGARGVTAVVYAVGGTAERQKDIGKSAGEWHFDLQGKDKR
jgi:hypothetical protein